MQEQDRLPMVVEMGRVAGVCAARLQSGRPGTGRRQASPFAISLDSEALSLAHRRIHRSRGDRHCDRFVAADADLRIDGDGGCRPADALRSGGSGFGARGFERLRSISGDADQAGAIGFSAAAGGSAFQTAGAGAAAGGDVDSCARGRRAGDAEAVKGDAASEYLSAADQLPVRRIRNWRPMRRTRSRSRIWSTPITFASAVRRRWRRSWRSRSRS